MIGGLGAKLAMLKAQRPLRECERCGLYFDSKLETCPHCSELDNAGLLELKQKIERQHQANKNLGVLFFYLAVLIGIGLLLMAI